MINKNIAAFTITAALVISGAAHASEELSKKSGCNSCHAIDKKLVGPAFKDVAAKYKGQKSADTMLAAKVKKGGSGVWGVIPMPPNTGVSDEDALTLTKWVLAQ